MKVTLEYPGRHHYVLEYTQAGTDYCPSCGSVGTVWVEGGEGDYYRGPTNLCTHCEASFTIQGPGKADEPHRVIIDQIKSGKQIAPTTKKGG